MKNKKILLFILCLPVLLAMPYSTLGQGIDISSGGSIAVSGAATIEINNGSFIHNGTYTKGAETFTMSGATTPRTISGTSLSDFNNLTVTNTAGISIAYNSKVTVSGELTVNASSLLTLSSTASGTASLIQSTPGVAATVQRYIAAWSNSLHGWHFLSSPVAAQAISDFHVPGSVSNDFYKWDEISNNWINRTASNGTLNTAFETSFVPGAGYLIANGTESTKFFSGTLNVAGVPVTGLTMTGSKAYTGWHLIGNPFSSALAWNNGSWNLNNVDGQCQIWDETGASYIPAIISPDGIIPAMNGFMVHASADNASLTIPASARVHDSHAWYKSSEQSNNLIVLVAMDAVGNTAQKSVIRFNADATEGYDTEFDSYFLAGFAPMFYSKSQAENYALNTLPESGVTSAIAMGFVKNANSLFTIELSENIPGLSVYLTDQKTSQTKRLNDGGYTFTSAVGDNSDRFLLNFLDATSIADIEKAKDFSVYAIDGILNIQSLNQLGGKVMVTDMVGRTIATGRVDAGATTRMNIQGNTGVYIVSVLTAKGRINTKVIVK